jgi:putative endonuclease
MARHNQTGIIGETLAKKYFEALGYGILHANWRWAPYEIDLIAYKSGVLHFIEVKTRRSNRFGHPEESIDRKKLENLMKAGAVFLTQHPEWTRIQYDVLAVMLSRHRAPEFFLIEDVYLHD